MIEVNDIFSGELRDLSLLGIINKRLIISYKGSNCPIAFYYRNLKILQRFDDQDDSVKFTKYGFKGSRYSDFEVANSEEIVLVSNNDLYELMIKDKGKLEEIINNNKSKFDNSKLILFKIKNNGSISLTQIESFLDEIKIKVDL